MIHYLLIFPEDILNNAKPADYNKLYFSSEDEGIVCNCLPECERIIYNVNVDAKVQA